MSTAETLYRRAPHVVCYWKGGEFQFHSYATGLRSGASPLACDVLSFFDDWKPLTSLQEHKPFVDLALLTQLVDALVNVSVLHRSDRPLSPTEQAMGAFDAWNPEAGLFHTATKDVYFFDIAAGGRALTAKAETVPMPSPIKRHAGAPVFELPRPSADLPITDVLLSRRSWRRFGEGSLPLDVLATLLGITAGVQYWVKIPGQGQVALKTSPSGGARHAIELYIHALKVDGLPTGLYHYVPDVHVLECVKCGVDAARVPVYVPRGDYWSDACALVFFSAVYDRELWRYGYSRAYRAPLIEAGHLCQTFCLLATAYQLAPFCAMALSDSAIESDLQLDGIRESVLYAAGVGIRPTGTDWALAPVGFNDPEAEPNPHVAPVRGGPGVLSVPGQH